jgi:hypothetical protein
MYEKKEIFSFVDNVTKSTTSEYNDAHDSFADKPYASYEFYVKITSYHYHYHYHYHYYHHSGTSG